MLRYNIHLRFIALALWSCPSHWGVSRGRPLLEWHLQNNETEYEVKKEEKWKRKKHIIYIWKMRAFYKNSRWADLVCERAGGAEWFRWITVRFLGLSECMVSRAKGTDTHAWSRTRAHTRTHTHTSPPPLTLRKLWVGVGFQMATQSYHCAPVNTMKTKLTHRWHSTLPSPPPLPNHWLPTQLRLEPQKRIIKRYGNLNSKHEILKHTVGNVIKIN